MQYLRIQTFLHPISEAIAMKPHLNGAFYSMDRKNWSHLAKVPLIRSPENMQSVCQSIVVLTFFTLLTCSVQAKFFENMILRTL